MDSCDLSAGSLRFLILPFPTEEFGLPCSRLTEGIDHPSDLIGVTLFRMCEKQPVRMPSLLRGLGIRSCDLSARRDRCPIHHRMSRFDDQTSRSLIKGSFAFIRPIFSLPGRLFRLEASLDVIPCFPPHRYR